MKKILQLIALTVLFVLGNFVFTRDVQAQAFFCEYNIGEDKCYVHASSGCSNNNAPANVAFCAGFDGDEDGCDTASSICSDCESPKECRPGSCSGDYIDAEGTCTGSSVCCINVSVTPPPATDCWECIQGPPNTCFRRNPVAGKCDPFWESQVVCQSACDNFQITSYTCFDPGTGTVECKAAANGEYKDGVPVAGLNAFANCSNDCLGYSFSPVPPTSTPPALCGDKVSIDTAVGCIPVIDSTKFSGTLLVLGIGLGGGISLFLIGVAAIMINTSAGDPRKLRIGQDVLVGAIAGLLLMIFSTVVLRFIGVSILGIIGLGS